MESFWALSLDILRKDQSKRTVSTVSTRTPINPAPLDAGMLLALNLTIGLGHFLVLFNTGAYLPMIPRVAGSLGVDPVYVDWTQANFFLAMALAFPTAAWFLNRWGGNAEFIRRISRFRSCVRSMRSVS